MDAEAVTREAWLYYDNEPKLKAYHEYVSLKIKLDDVMSREILLEPEEAIELGKRIKKLGKRLRRKKDER